MRRINSQILQRGDILLTTSPELTSKAIRKGINSDISHAMICVAAGSVIDSTPEGVHAKNVEKLFYPDDCAIHVLRLRRQLSISDMDQVINYARAAIATPYSVSQAAKSLLSPKTEGTRKQFCSRLVARAYATCGVYLTDNPDFCKPSDIQDSPLLKAVEPAWLLTTQQEIDSILAHGDATQLMRDVTNKLHDAFRKIDNTVLTEDDVCNLIVEQPNLDAKIASAYIESGYLDYWKTLEQHHPWRYDFEKLVALALQAEGYAITEYCNATIQQNKDGAFSHWFLTLQALRQLHATHKLRTFELLIGLYENLTHTHIRRVHVAERWLAAVREHDR